MAEALPLLERYTVSEGEVRARTIRFSGVLDEGEKLTGVPTIEDESLDLVFSGVQVNGVPKKVSGKPTPAYESVSLTTQGQRAVNGPYRFSAAVATTLGQTLRVDVIMDVAGQPSG